jgi:hypothetical protein
MYNRLVTNTHNNTDASGGAWMCVAILYYVKKDQWLPKKSERLFSILSHQVAEQHQQVVLCQNTVLMNVKHFEWTDNLQGIHTVGYSNKPECLSHACNTPVHTRVCLMNSHQTHQYMHICAHTHTQVHMHTHTYYTYYYYCCCCWIQVAIMSPVLWLAMSWVLQGSNPDGGRDFPQASRSALGPPSLLLHNG